MMIEQSHYRGVRGNRGEGRHCVNDYRNVEYGPWKRTLEALTSPRSSAMAALSLLFPDEELCFLRAGGDVVDAGSPAEGNGACMWHADWPGWPY